MKRKSPVRNKHLKDQFRNKYTAEVLHQRWGKVYEASRIYEYMKEIYALVFDGTKLTNGTGTIVSDSMAWCYKLTGDMRKMRSYVDRISDDVWSGGFDYASTYSSKKNENRTTRKHNISGPRRLHSRALFH